MCAGSGPDDRLFSGRWEWMRCHVTREKEAETELGHSFFLFRKKGMHGIRRKAVKDM